MQPIISVSNLVKTYASGLQALKNVSLDLLAAGGDLPAALLAYRDHRSRLRREMNLEPDAATARLFQELRDVVFARDLGPRNGLLRARFGDRAWYRYRPAGSATDTANAFLPEIARDEDPSRADRGLIGAAIVTGLSAGNPSLTRLLVLLRRSLPEPALLSPLLSVVPGQLFALALARARGLDPDAPHGLAKVTLAS
mgnify:CR=1 FL=1